MPKPLYPTRRASRGNIPTQKPQATVPPIQGSRESLIGNGFWSLDSALGAAPVRALLVSKLPDADSAGSLEAQLPSMTIAPAALESEPGAIRPHNENKITDATTEK